MADKTANSDVNVSGGGEGSVGSVSQGSTSTPFGGSGNLQQPRSGQTPSRSGGDVRVKMLSNDEFDGHYLAYEVDDISQVHLVPKDDMKYSVREQSVSRDVLNRSKKPYMWDDEIDQMAISRDEVRLALLRGGLVNKQEKVDLRELTAKALSGGVIPFVKK